MVKQLLISILMVTMISACGDDGRDSKDGLPGLTGSEGSPALDVNVLLDRFSSDTSLCPSGSGLIVTVTKGEVVTAVSAVCDGVDGLNGEDGIDGQDGASAPQSPLAITEIIDPCGDAPGIYDEILLKLYDGTIIASFSDKANGQNTRLSVLTPGAKVTTDGSNCHFVINNEGGIL